MHQAEIIFGQKKIVKKVESGTLVSSVLLAHGIPFSMPCAGNHTCGKCKVKVAGVFSTPAPSELRFLSVAEQSQGIRLACFAEIMGDCRVVVETAGEKARVLSEQNLPAVPVRPRVPEGVGMAVDVGTTTVVAYLYDLSDGKLLDIQSGMNTQRVFGADVISRINYSNEHGMAPLKESIRNQLNYMVEAALRQAGKKPQELKEIVIAGNTTMLHCLTGLDPQGIAVAPFTPVSLFGAWGEERFPAAPEAEVYLPHCISSYVGADITCSILASGMMKQKTALLLDLGTNGEMVLWHGGKLLCCSTAVGPAFEGAGMQMGMTAMDGAIHKVWEKDGTVAYSVLGNQPPAGICGSGLLDAASVFLRLGCVDETGRIDEDSDGYQTYGVEFGGFPALKIGESGVILTQEDIRKLQLAKGAVAAGIETLLAEAGCAADEVETLYLAGGFGNYIDVDSAVAIGLLPEVLREKVRVLGNAAGAGAFILLLDRETEALEKAVAGAAEEISLSSSAVFMEHYVAQMMFGQNP